MVLVHNHGVGSCLWNVVRLCSVLMELYPDFQLPIIPGCLTGTFASCRIDILGSGAERIYLLGKLLTHPPRALGATACGKKCGDLASCRYHKRTSCWCLPSICFAKIIA